MLYRRRDCNNATTDIFCQIIDEDRVPPPFTQDIVICEPYIPAMRQGAQGKIDWKPLLELPDPSKKWYQLIAAS